MWPLKVMALKCKLQNKRTYETNISSSESLFQPLCSCFEMKAHFCQMKPKC